MKFANKTLRALYETERSHGLPQNLVPRISRILGTLSVATSPSDIDIPGYRLHSLKGNRTGYWSVRVSANWRIVFRFVEGEAVDVNLIDYH